MRSSIRLAVLGIGCALIGPLRAQDLVPSETSAAVPFQLAADFLVVVEGQVGDVGGLRFIVDTAATRSVIDRKVAAKLHLRPHTGKQIVNFNRLVPTEYVDAPAFQMGPLRAEGLRVMVANLLEYSEFAKGVDGIVGLDLLSRSEKFTIDYAKKRLYFELAPNEISRPVPGCFIVPVVVQGTTVRLGVDTGLAEILLYGNRLKKYQGNIRTEGEPKTVTMGRLEGRKVALPGVQLGDPEEAITVVLIDGPAARTTPGLDGYLGIASLHANQIEFDFARMTLRWQ